MFHKYMAQEQTVHLAVAAVAKLLIICSKSKII